MGGSFVLNYKLRNFVEFTGTVQIKNIWIAKAESGIIEAKHYIISNDIESTKNISTSRVPATRSARDVRISRSS